MLTHTKSSIKVAVKTQAVAKAQGKVGPIVHTRVAADLAAAIEAVLTPAVDGLDEETVADFVRTALWNEAMRRGQTRPPLPIGLPELVKKIDAMAEQIQSLKNMSRLQNVSLESLTAQFEGSGN